MDENDTTIKLDGLQSIIKALKGNIPVAKVGILGSKNSRSGGAANSNATVGAIHEFGTSKVPMRSFLRIPITNSLQKNLEKAGAFDEQALKDVIKTKSLVPWLEKAAIEAVGIVLDAFDTSGDGQWLPLKPETMKRKKVKQILIETAQLRNSITYEVTT